MKAATRLKSTTNAIPTGVASELRYLRRGDGPCLSDISFGHTTVSPLAARVDGSRPTAPDVRFRRDHSDSAPYLGRCARPTSPLSRDHPD